MPTVAAAGRPVRSDTISEPVEPIVAVAVLLVLLPSLLAPVVPVSVLAPLAVGVPETVHAIDAPGATLTGGVGAQDAVRPAGKPASEQVAAVAAIAGAAALEQVKAPL